MLVTTLTNDMIIFPIHLERTKWQDRYRASRRRRKWLHDDPAATDNANGGTLCQSKFQQTQLRVLAKFFSGCLAESYCWMPSQQDRWFDVTALTASRLEVSGHGSVHIDSDGRVLAGSSGLVRVRLQSTDGGVLAQTKLSVQRRGRVKLRRVSAHLITALNSSLLDVNPRGEGRIHVTLESVMRCGDRGFLAAQLHFEDGHSMALRHLPTEAYFLQMKPLTKAVRLVSKAPPQLGFLNITDGQKEDDKDENRRLVSVQLFAPPGCLGRDRVLAPKVSIYC